MHDTVTNVEDEQSETRQNNEEENEVNENKSERRPPRVDPKLAHWYPFWKSPLTEHQWDRVSTPNVIHIVENKAKLISRLHHLRESLYLPLTKCSVFYCHWLQNLMDVELKFYLHPMHDFNLKASAHYEGIILMRKLRYILAKFEWNSVDPVRLQLEMAENHGNSKRSKRRKLRPMYSHTVFIDHATASVLFKGTEFMLTVSQPFPGDLERSSGDPGGRVDVGIYTRELDTDPDIQARWFISLERQYLRHVPLL